MTDGQTTERIELLIKELDLVFGVGFTGIDRPGFDTDNGTHVTDPTMSECGRFDVDPCDEYGEYKVLRWIKESEHKIFQWIESQA